MHPGPEPIQLDAWPATATGAETLENFQPIRQMFGRAFARAVHATGVRSSGPSLPFSAPLVGQIAPGRWPLGYSIRSSPEKVNSTVPIPTSAPAVSSFPVSPSTSEIVATYVSWPFSR